MWRGWEIKKHFRRKRQAQKQNLIQKGNVKIQENKLEWQRISKAKLLSLSSLSPLRKKNTRSKY
jgi:hypothetical protein